MKRGVRGLGWTVRLIVLALLAFVTPALPAGADADIELPEGYVKDLIHGSSAAGPVVSSHDGTVFMRYGDPSGVTRVARLDVAGGSLVDVFHAPPWMKVEWLVGGPGATFFVSLDGVMTQVAADGTMSTWSTAPLPGAPLRYSADGRMIGIGAGGTEVIEIHPDGTSTTLLSGRTGIYDLVVAADGTIYISDFPAEELIELAADGSTRVITPIAPDNTNLALDGAGRLHLNNAAVGFNLVDVATGALTPVTAPAAPCNVIASPGEVAFDAAGRAVFFSWVEHRITWVDPATGQGGRVLEPTWANTTAADVGPDGALYVGVSGCGTSPATVRRVDADATATVRASGSIGGVYGLAVTSTGGVFVAGGTETFAGLYYAASGDTALSLVPGSGPTDIGPLAAFPSDDEVLAHLGEDPVIPGAIRLGRFSTVGKVAEYTIIPPEPVQEFTLGIAPDGTVYAQASEAANYFVGPVKRWLLRLDLDTGTTEVVFRHDRMGCCPFDSFGVDTAGDLWWVLNPDFVVYHVEPAGAAELFASQTPVDAGYVNQNSKGDVFLNSPEGLYRVWQATLAERLALVNEAVDDLVTFGALSSGRGRSLSAKLHAAATTAERGNHRAAEAQVDAFLRSLSRFVVTGHLDEKPADHVVEVMATLGLSASLG